MSKTKQAIKEVNKMADKSIINAKKEKFRKEFEAWWTNDVTGIKNWHICAGVVVVAIIANIMF